MPGPQPKRDHKHSTWPSTDVKGFAEEHTTLEAFKNLLLGQNTENPAAPRPKLDIEKNDKPTEIPDTSPTTAESPAEEPVTPGDSKRLLPEQNSEVLTESTKSKLKLDTEKSDEPTQTAGSLSSAAAESPVEKPITTGVWKALPLERNAENSTETPDIKAGDMMPHRRPIGIASEQIHIMGSDLVGRYIAHTLASCLSIPPVRYLIHRYNLFAKWGEVGRELTLYRGNEKIVNRRVIGERIYRWDPAKDPVPEGGFIDNLIMTVPASSAVAAFSPIRHRLDQRSTICLIQEGLGAAEALIDAYFPDEGTRPIFLLGHFSTTLGFAGHHYEVAEIQPRRLYLTLYMPSGGKGMQRIVKRHPPVERTGRAMNFIRLLTAIPGLNATGHPNGDWFRYKLPNLAFHAVGEPLTALMGCTYDKLPYNAYARHLMDTLVSEICDVVARLPETRFIDKFQRLGLGQTLHKDVLKKIKLQNTADSKMRNAICRGRDNDIDFLTGYFVKRGREVGVKVPTLESIMWAIKAKRLAHADKQLGYIPFEEKGEQPLEEDFVD